jgi:hypothetical protein
MAYNYYIENRSFEEFSESVYAGGGEQWADAAAHALDQANVDRAIERAWVRGGATRADDILGDVSLPPLGSLRREAEETERVTAKKKAEGFDFMPYVHVDPRDIEPRQWLYGTSAIRGFLSILVAPGGLGKSSLALAESIAIATGVPILGETIHEQNLRCAYVNLEDPLEELQRKVAAATLHYGDTIDPAVLEDRLFLNGAETPLCVATETKNGTKIVEPVYDRLADRILKYGISKITIDPFISSHQVPENDTNSIDMVAKRWAQLGRETNSSIELVHHMRKGQRNQESTVEDARGAKALTDAARIVRLLQRISEKDAKDMCLEHHWLYFRVDDGKANLAPPNRAAIWRKIENVALGNAMHGRQQDFVGVVTPYDMANIGDGLSMADVNKALDAIEDGDWQTDVRAGPKQDGTLWVGRAIAEALKLEIPKDRETIKTYLDTWFRRKYIKRVSRQNSERKLREFVVVDQRPGDDFDDLDAESASLI